MVTLSAPAMDRLDTLVATAMRNVTRGLTEMFAADVAITALHVRTVPLARIGGLIGSPEQEVVAVLLAAEGELAGTMLLMMPIDIAYELCDILLEMPAGTTLELDEMGISALGEVGNIVGSFFLNSIADEEGLCIHITPPALLCDMAGAAIDLAVMEVAMAADEAVVIDAMFEHRGRHLPAWFLAFPDPAGLAAILCQKVPA